ncbi:MAG TPA: DUF6541 family protein [Candidatus Thermoplasmatota archaeon]|nr:DUF6541 family protein [Candidatus Thermoplasmatota archaeon]
MRDLRRPALLAGALALYALAVLLRLRDPLSFHVIGAEDPFSHMVITKELVARGYHAGPETLDGPLYPPGIHALTAVLWTSSGLPLYDLARVLPPFLGALGVLGIAALLHREAGPWAALAGGLVAAAMPEHIFRTNLLFPTTLDLALIPVYLWALARLVDGETPAAWLLGIAGAAIAGAHPWALMLLGPIGLLYVGLRVAFPRDGHRSWSGAGLAAALGGGMALATYLWWRDASFIGLGGFSKHARDVLPLTSAKLGIPQAALVGLLAAAVLLLVAAAVLRPRLPRSLRVGGGLAVGLALAGGVLWAWLQLRHDLPTYVDYGKMLTGAGALLALAGLALAPLLRSRAGDLGVAVCVVTFPFTAIDFFQSIYWSHRTVAYLSLGVALLAGVAVGAAVEALARARLPFARPVAGAAALVALLVLTVPAATAMQPWYRYETREEFAVIEAARDAQLEDPRAVVIAGDWRPNLFLRAIGDEQRVVWAPDEMKDPAALRALGERLEAEGKRPYVLVDRHTREALGLAYRAPPGEPVASCCGGAVILTRLAPS